MTRKPVRRMEFFYRFPVVRGMQAKREYYIAMVPLKMLPKLFPAEDEFLPPEYRAQRRLNEKRIPVISRYILENRESYVFSALAASIDGEFRFVPAGNSPDTGVLEISMDARFLINDGQHRKAAIEEAIKESPDLADETISIVLYRDKGLERCQQIFTDLNKNAVKTSNSISELYDSRDSMAVTTRSVVGRIGFLNRYTDKEKDILGKYSSSLFTLNTFYNANRAIAGRGQDPSEKFLFAFWNGVTAHMTQWRELEEKRITKVDLRENYISSQAVVIQALGRVGHDLLRHPETDPAVCLTGLERIDWNRRAEVWRLRAVNTNGRILTNRNAVVLISNVIKKALGLPLSGEEEAAERELTKRLSA